MMRAPAYRTRIFFAGSGVWGRWGGGACLFPSVFRSRAFFEKKREAGSAALCSPAAPMEQSREAVLRRVRDTAGPRHWPLCCAEHADRARERCRVQEGRRPARRPGKEGAIAYAGAPSVREDSGAPVVPSPGPAYRTRIFFAGRGVWGRWGAESVGFFLLSYIKDGNRASAGLFSVPAFFRQGPPTGGSLPNAASDDLRLSGPQGCGGFCLQSRKRKQKRDPTGREPSAACSVCAGSRSQGRKNVRPAVYRFFSVSSGQKAGRAGRGRPRFPAEKGAERGKSRGRGMRPCPQRREKACKGEKYRVLGVHGPVRPTERRIFPPCFIITR